MHFGASLRLLRLHSGWSLRDLGAAVGVSSAYLSRVENGHDAPPTPDRILALAHTLGAPGELLLELAGRPAADTAASTLAADALLREVQRRRLTPAQVGRVLEFIATTFPTPPLVREGAVVPLLSAARVARETRVAAIEEAVDVAAQRLAPEDPAPLADALRHGGSARCSVGGGLALPHTAEGPPAAALLLLAAPLAAPTPDGVPLRALLALTGVPPGPPGLALLGNAARLGDPCLLDALAAAPDGASVVELLRVFEGG